MAETSFTKGPWRVDPEHAGDVQTEDGREICSAFSNDDVGNEWRITGDIPWDCEEKFANVALISAAPEMYEQLQSARDKLARLVAEAGGDEYAVAMACDPYDATLRKARGEA
jgi:hypothetical protein